MIKINEFNFVVEPDPLVIGQRNVKYYDANTDRLLGGWETFKSEEEITATVAHNYDAMLKAFNDYWSVLRP